MEQCNELDAISLIKSAAAEPSLDELARRAREVLALQAPSDTDLADLVRYWRLQRAALGKREAKVEE